jgi:hypothetical protein
MGLEAQSLVVLRVVGGLFGLYVIISGFYRFRERRISRGEAFFSWLLGCAAVTITAYPDSVNFIVSMLAMEKASYGRMLALLVISTLVVWFLILRERGKVYVLRRTVDRLIRYVASRTANEEFEKLGDCDILVALPALNEAENVGSVLDKIPNTIRDNRVRVVVIDDGSEDDTVRVVRDHGHAVVSNPMRRGQGAALRLAYDVAREVGAKVVVTLDADGQHRPEEIEGVVTPILDDEQDFVVGSRLLGSREADSAFRLTGIYVNNTLINMLAGTRISDCSSGFKAIRVSCLDRMNLFEDQFQAAEAIIAAAHSGLRIGEAPITVKRRMSGTSKKGKDVKYGLNFMRTVFKSWWR